MVEAAAECAAHGLQLCTRQEIENSCCNRACQTMHTAMWSWLQVQGTKVDAFSTNGTVLDHAWVWTSDACNPFGDPWQRRPKYLPGQRVPQIMSLQGNKPSGPLPPAPTEQSVLHACPARLNERCDLPFRSYPAPDESQCRGRELPLIGHCIAGLARTLVEPVVYRSIEENYLRAIGGRSVLLMYLKTWSTSRKTRGDAFESSVARDTLPWWNHEAELALLRALQYLRPQGVHLVHSQQEENVHANPNCTKPTGTLSVAHSIYTTPAGLARHMGQLAASTGCLNMLREHEASYPKLRFSYFVRSRPDLAYPVPVPPYCHFDRKRYTYGGRIDWFYVFGRGLLEAALDLQARHYKTCSGVPWWGYVYEKLVEGSVKRVAGKRAVKVGSFLVLLVRTGLNSSRAPCHGHEPAKLGAPGFDFNGTQLMRHLSDTKASISTTSRRIGSQRTVRCTHEHNGYENRTEGAVSVGVMLVGEARSFLRRLVWHSAQRFLIAPLQRSK